MNRFNLSAWALQHRAFTGMLMVLLVVGGSVGYVLIGQGEDPKFTFRVMVIKTLYPGATAAEVEAQITDRLEKKLQELPKRLPASLLDQRPDLRLAKTQVDAAAASLGAARADLYPRLILSVSGGYGTVAAGVYALGSGISAPIFNAGRIRAQIAAADARLDQAAANYERTFLTALADVENAYVQHRAMTARHDRLLQAETSAEVSHREADALFRQGATDLLGVIDAQRSKLQISDQRIGAETAMAVAMVSLYRAFGGGWSEDPGPLDVASELPGAGNI